MHMTDTMDIQDSTNMQTSGKDNLTEDLQAIITGNAPDLEDRDANLLLENLIRYIVNRDHKVLEHGIKVGRQNGNDR